MLLVRLNHRNALETISENPALKGRPPLVFLLPGLRLLLEHRLQFEDPIRRFFVFLSRLLQLDSPLLFEVTNSTTVLLVRHFQPFHLLGEFDSERDIVILWNPSKRKGEKMVSNRPNHSAPSQNKNKQTHNPFPRDSRTSHFQNFDRASTFHSRREAILHLQIPRFPGRAEAVPFEFLLSRRDGNGVVMERGRVESL